jgi:hypothetical protein
MKNEKVVMVGFGTLLLQESLNDTVSKEVKINYTPVIVKNYRRLFNLLPDHYKADNRLRSDFTETGAHNIEPAKGFYFNGLSFDADAADLENLDKRERYYKRSEVPYFDFDTGKELGLCHVYESPLEARWIQRDINKLLPLWRDIVYARVGAYRISESFGKMYDETTYLADGYTLMVGFYKNYLDKLTDFVSVRAQYSK